MIKIFFKHSFIYALGTVFTRGIAIFLVPIYTRYLSPSEYGVIDFFLIIAAIINLTIALEISQSIARFYQEAHDKEDKVSYTSTAFWFTFVVYFFYFCISWSFSDSLSQLLLDSKEYQMIFIWASLAIATNGIFYFTQNQLRWQIQPKDSVIVSIVNVMVVATVAIYLLVIMKLKVESIFIAQILGNTIGSLQSIYYAKSNYKFIFDFVKLKEMLVFSSPLVLSGVGVFIAMYIDRIAIKELLGLNELGIYGVAFRFAAVASLVMIGFQSSLMPLVYKYYKEAETLQSVSKIFNMFCLFALFVVAASIIFSKEVLVLFTTEAFYGASSLIALLVMATFFSNMYIFAPGIGIAKKTKLTAMITISTAILNTILNYTLIPVFGLSGAAYATLMSAIIGFLLYAVLAYKYYPIPYKIKNILIAFATVLISAYAMVYKFDEITFGTIGVKIIYMLVISVVISFLLVERKYMEKFIRI
ncbi:oligosaccharide flippase family protein [Arcobacter caeni]|uniref:Uncharacterized protein n=1 Tax=Arcobacter caeni TaxID=1912877 RepID=A0A363CXI8_9BACT|nr:oligosaccharide flippase family protein [Arcobacter caeni]PUE63761.1 hypothetical protein B0174_09440 [Arcobacter caeni]